MSRFDRTRFVAFGISSALNAIALALYALGLATHGIGGAANAQPVLFVLIGVCLLGAMYTFIKRGHDIGRPGWQIVLAFWIALGGGPLLLVLIGYLALAKGTAGDNAYGPPPQPMTAATWFWAAVALAAPWMAFAIAARLA